MRTKPRVAIQGIAASFHEAAAMNWFDVPIRTIECLTFHDLCESLAGGQSDFAVMAIENSIAGSILPNFALLEKHRFNIRGEIYVPIHLHLLALPGITLDEIETVESHPMALRQCSEFLHTLPGVAIRESDDTALSAKRIGDEGLRSFAAVASERAAKRFGLAILARRIETSSKNFTRFLVLSRNGGAVNGSNKASLAFEVADEVGSLATVLSTFKRHGINLSLIQSIPIVGRPSAYSIHVDVTFPKRADYDVAIERIQDQVVTLNVLGEYKKAEMRFEP
ncbi:MAG: prephenate dehydratase [Acidobacteria bacterium]|nr:prephenate dehydratase [Acidobacteriota bacterium]